MRASDEVNMSHDQEATRVENAVDGQMGVKPIKYVSVSATNLTRIDGEIVDEVQLCISVNGRELATLMCSPSHPKQLALGFLLNEGLISSIDDVRSIHLSKSDTCLDIWLQDINLELPQRGIITAGCGGGITFDDLSQQHQPLSSNLNATPDQLARLMRKTHLGAELYRRARGIHRDRCPRQDTGVAGGHGPCGAFGNHLHARLWQRRHHRPRPGDRRSVGRRRSSQGRLRGGILIGRQEIPESQTYLGFL